MEWIPLVNVIWDIYKHFSPAAVDPAWWEYVVHIAETVAFAQVVIMLGVWDKLAALTETDVDDHALVRLRGWIAQAAKLLLAVSAIDPKLQTRVKNALAPK